MPGFYRKGFLVLALVAALALLTVPLGAQDMEETEFVFAHPGPIRTLDAPVTWFISTHWLANLLYDCLIWRTVDGSGYVGQAAESWENVDATTWRFNLRPGITFHNGEPLDANAVKWNIDRVRTREDFMVQPQWVDVAEVIVVDDVTVDIKTVGPTPYFEFIVSFNGCELLPPGYIEEVGEEQFARAPVGSGPYVLSEFTESDRYVFEAWDGYWGGRPSPDRVIYQVIPEQSAQVAALLAGQVDMVSNVPAVELPGLEAAEDIVLTKETAAVMQHIYLRVDTTAGNMAETYPDYQPATLDLNVRQALSHALDRDLLAEVHGAAVPRLGRICPHFPEGGADSFNNPETVTAHYDPDLARSLLAEAGYADGGPTVYFDTPTVSRGGNEKEVAEVVSAMLEEVGFNVELTVLDPAAFGEQINSPGNNRDMMMVTLGCSVPLVPLFYRCVWPAAHHDICVEEWDEVSNAILSEMDSAARLELWGQWWDHWFGVLQNVTLYEVQANIAYSSDFEFTPRKDGWYTFRDNLKPAGDDM
ncbi:MAG: ABC transporter substrate-binding protein [Anaerolineaceae bacterium]|nr:ABC transporter substrate-binding protein [Anaerolineaceae bacterium]MCY3907637.1 ABC transporter substrate-binding protein [Anaerolineaceae bacterium]